MPVVSVAGSANMRMMIPKNHRDLWHRRPRSLDKAALSLAMGNDLTSVDFARSAVVLGSAAVLSSLRRFLSHSADSTLPAFLRSTCGSGCTGLPDSLLRCDLRVHDHVIVASGSRNWVSLQERGVRPPFCG
jgi:hypothetical protein